MYLGNVYIADWWNNRVRKVAVATDIITTIAGTGDYGFSGDGGPATLAELYYPQEVALDSSGRPILTLFTFVTYRYLPRQRVHR